MKNYKLHLIRHGLTEGNLKGQYLGAGTDSPLCKEGIEKLYLLKEKFSYPNPEKIYTSPMKRALETTEIVFKDEEYTIVSDLRECNFGEFEGKTFSELISEDENFSKWLDPKSGYTPKGGESSMDFANRCAGALNEIFTDMMKNGIFEAAAVCHGGVIAVLMTMFAYPQKPTSEWTSDNGCGFTVQTTTANWTRDNIIEATNLVPFGYDNSEAKTNKFRK